MPEAEVIQNAAAFPVQPKKKRPWWKRLIRLFAWTAGIFLFLVVLLVALTYIYQDEVKGYVVEEVNKRVNTTVIVDPANIDLTIIRSFPDVSVEFRNIAALDALPLKKRDTLFRAGEISLAFNIVDLFKKNYSVHNITMKDAMVNLWVDEKGRDNFHFLKEDTAAGVSDTSHVAFALDEILLKNVSCLYSDRKEKSSYDVRIDDASFTGDFGTELYDFGTEANFTVNRLQRGSSSFFGGNKGSLDLVMEINHHTGLYQVRTGKLRLSDLLMNVSGNVKEAGKNYALDLSVKGEDIDLPAALSLLPASFHDEIGEFESSGEFYIDAAIKGAYGDSVSPVVKAQFGVKPGATIGRKNSNVRLTDVSLKGLFSNEKGKEGLQISSFSITAAKSKFTGSFGMNGFDRPAYSSKLSGRVDLGEMQEILQLDTVEKVSGIMNISFEGSGRPGSSTPTVSDFRTFKTSGQVGLTGVSLKLKGGKEAIDSISGKLSFDGNNVGISAFTARTRESDLLINGKVRNLLGYLFTDKEVLDISGDLVSSNLDLNQLLADGNSTAADTNYHLGFSDRLKLKLNTSIRHLVFRRFEASDISGSVVLSRQRLVADPVSFHAMDGAFSGSGMIDASQKKDSLLITCNADIRDVNISKLFWQLENFGQEGQEEVITDKNVKGKLTAQADFASVWGSDLAVNDRKIYTDADVRIDQGELIDFKPLEVLSKFIRLEDLKDIKFKTLSNHIAIKNRMINIPKMEINSSAINISMSGTHDFDNMVDYHFIVDLDELRAKKAKGAKKENSEFGEEIDDGGHRTRLFISMKGPIDDPDIKYDSKGAAQQIREDLKQEKQNLKQILNEEFGWFGKDKEKKEDRKKEGDNKFILKQDEDTAPADKKKKKPKDEELDDSGDY